MKHKPATIYSGKVGAKPIKTKTTVSKRVHKEPWYCYGGPMDGHTLYLNEPTTMLMKINGESGRYCRGNWEAVCD